MDALTVCIYPSAAAAAFMFTVYTSENSRTLLLVTLQKQNMCSLYPTVSSSGGGGDGRLKAFASHLSGFLKGNKEVSRVMVGIERRSLFVVMCESW
jgi:hypothetical protein